MPITISVQLRSNTMKIFIGLFLSFLILQSVSANSLKTYIGNDKSNPGNLVVTYENCIMNNNTMQCDLPLQTRNITPGGFEIIVNDKKGRSITNIVSATDGVYSSSYKSMGVSNCGSSLLGLSEYELSYNQVYLLNFTAMDGRVFCALAQPGGV